MSVLVCVMIVMCRSSPDGEEYFGSPELFGDQQDQQEYVNQGKYSMGLPLLSYSFLSISLCMCILLQTIRTS